MDKVVKLQPNWGTLIRSNTDAFFLSVFDRISVQKINTISANIEYQLRST